MTNIIDTIRKIDGYMATGDESEGEMSRRRFDREKFRAAADTMAKLIDLTNTMGSEEHVVAGIVEGIIRSHRHLQYKGILAIFQALGEFGALPEGQFTDGRNAFAHKLCGLLRERFRDELFWKDGE